MSEMPAGKKKSRFQITSVTQAQVAVANIPDDTESQDDPDESRTEDVSSEIFDVSRVELGVCDRSSSEETLESQEPATGPVNGGLPYKSSAAGRVTPHTAGAGVPVPVAAAQPFVSSSNTAVSTAAAPTAPSTSCSSRFRVIKLDHGTGEPFRRGRWTCTEFYERDSDSNINRTVDTIKPAATIDHSIDRDSGLGATNNSVITSSTFSAQALENTVESGFSVSVGHPAHSNPPDSLQQGYSLPPQIGSGGSAFQSTGYTTTASQQPKQAQVNKQPVTPQAFLSNSLNGVHQAVLQQKSSIIPPATQAQQFAYAAHPTASSSHPDYHQQHFGSSTQTMTSSSAGGSGGHVSSPQIVPAGQGTQGQGGEAGSAQGLTVQGGNPQAMVPSLPGNAHQHPVSQAQPSGGLVVSPGSSIITTATTILSQIGGQSVPATVPSANSIPSSGASPVPGTGGQILLHRGAITGLQAEDFRQKTDSPSQHNAGPGKDGVKPSISEGFGLATPVVNNLFNIQITMDVDEDSASGASVVAIDNKIEQAMDLVKSHLMYAVREEVEVLKEQIKELYERNFVLERENAVLKSLANSEQLNHLSSQLTSPLAPLQQHLHITNAPSLVHHEGSQGVPHQPNITSA
ncbi:TSC22 domain family protein 2-like [Cololabis saira]|uniref:TSC22 domain family protein 2-like n=1 Tax=Cololabis saira TaxID=129043 RepID=UPI002AD59B41|nr:TSC22 domain family protein 2-like [Cololabis saira]